MGNPRIGGSIGFRMHERLSTKLDQVETKLV